MTEAEKTAALREAGKLLAKQILESLAYAAQAYAKDPFRIDKRSVVDEFRAVIDRFENAQDMMGVPPRVPAPIDEHTESLSLKTLDVHQKTAPINWVNKDFRHTGNRKVYRVMAVTWLGATDEWGVVMQEAGVRGAVSVTRPEHHLTGLRSNGQLRYEALNRPPEPKREVRRSGGWFGEDWLQYEGQHEGRTVHARYVAPPRLSDGKPDLSVCEVRVEPYDGVL